VVLIFLCVFYTNGKVSIRVIKWYNYFLLTLKIRFKIRKSSKLEGGPGDRNYLAKLLPHKMLHSQGLDLKLIKIVTSLCGLTLSKFHGDWLKCNLFMPFIPPAMFGFLRGQIPFF